jgi:3-methyladenine DNA glycosylase/8-oxoguanine DNA glycosylase
MKNIKAINYLIKSDPNLGRFIDFFNKKNFVLNDDYSKKSEFLSLVRIIIGQQLSINAANSIFSKFTNKYGENIKKIKLESSLFEDLLSLGLSKTKSNTIIEISELTINNSINLKEISKLEEKEAKDILCSIKGIGPWSVENFLLFSGNNNDICPANDLGIKKGIKIIYNLKELPKDNEVYKIAELWKPYRSIASRYIWEIVDQKINFA